MADSFLQLCRDLAGDLKIAGGPENVTTVTGLETTTGIVADLARWVRDGDTYIQGLWLDWDFMWVDETVTLSIASNVVPQPAAGDMNFIRKSSLVIREGTATARAPVFMEWDIFSARWLRSVMASSDYPTNYTRRPDGVLLLSHNMLTADSADYQHYRTPVRMTEDADESVILAFDGYAHETGRQCLLAKATMAYATREDAPEQMATAAAIYEDTLFKLEARYHAENQGHVLGSTEGQEINIIST